MKGATASANYGIYVNASGGGLNATGVRLHDNYGGFYFNSTKWGSRIADSSIDSNSDSGVLIQAATGIRIENCTISNNGNRGIHVNSAPDALIYGNHVHNNTGDGIFISSSSSGIGVHHNRVIDNGGEGIEMTLVLESSVTYNVVRDNNGPGIYSGARNSEILYNNVTGNSYGILIWGSCCSGVYGTNNLVGYNYVAENSYGIAIANWAGGNNRLLSNTILNSDTYGINIYSGNYHTIENSTIFGSGSSDLHITTGEHTIINSTFSTVTISSSADLLEKQLLSISTLETDGDPFAGFEVAVEVADGTPYASPHELKIEVATREPKLVEARQRLPEKAEQPPKVGGSEQLEGQRETLEGQRGRLGNVNMLSLEHYRQEEERLARIREDRKQLRREVRRLEALEAKISARKLERFSEVYKHINENFQSTFTELTGGGKAWLELEKPETIFDGGVSIKARMPRKRLFPVEALSGGEKSLVSMAFIFAIQRYDPSPFYLLDEPDQNLDGVNTEHIGRAIALQSAVAQFLVVSLHHAALREAAHVIGVFMADDGVSRSEERRGGKGCRSRWSPLP